MTTLLSFIHSLTHTEYLANFVFDVLMQTQGNLKIGLY